MKRLFILAVTCLSLSGCSSYCVSGDFDKCHSNPSSSSVYKVFEDG